MKKISFLSLLFMLSAIFFCCKNSCTNTYTGNWQFTTDHSINSNSSHDTEHYTGQISVLNNDSIHVYYTPVLNYPIDADCSTGNLDGDIYQGNHGWGYYTGNISNSTFKLTMVRFGGFPPYDTSYQVICGIKL